MVDMKDRRAPDNRTPYLQGRADQRRVDRIVAIACLIALAIYLVWRD
jgi:hypothetical protein